MSNDQTQAIKKTTPDIMRQPRKTGITDSTDNVMPIGRVNSVYVVASAACWLKFDASASAHTFTKSADADLDHDDSLEFKHPGGGASFPIIQEKEMSYLHCVADSGTVDIEVYPGGVTNG